MALVETPAGTTAPLDVADDPFAVRTILEEHTQDFLGVVLVRLGLKRLPALFGRSHLADLVVDDEALFLEDLGNARLQLGRGHIDGRRLDAVGIANAGQHIGNRVGHHGVSSCVEPSTVSGGSPALAYQLAFFTPGIRPLLAMSRKQIRQMPNLR